MVQFIIIKNEEIFIELIFDDFQKYFEVELEDRYG